MEPIEEIIITEIFDLTKQQRKWLNKLLNSNHPEYYMTLDEKVIVNTVLINGRYDNNERITLINIATYYKKWVENHNKEIENG